MSRVKGIISPIRPDLALERIFAFLGGLGVGCGGEASMRVCILRIRIVNL